MFNFDAVTVCWNRRRISVVRTSVFGRWTFWLTDDHFMGRLYAMGQPTSPGQLSLSFLLR